MEPLGETLAQEVTEWYLRLRVKKKNWRKAFDSPPITAWSF
jgi:hypothetical protein